MAVKDEKFILLKTPQFKVSITADKIKEEFNEMMEKQRKDRIEKQMLYAAE